MFNLIVFKSQKAIIILSMNLKIILKINTKSEILCNKTIESDILKNNNGIHFCNGV